MGARVVTGRVACAWVVLLNSSALEAITYRTAM